ncbi:MAG: cupin domain-containing protein [Thermodesulfobacteriota bacterium]
MAKPGNIFSNIPKHIPQEMFEEIITEENIKIERIISKGHATPDDKWYDQDKNEWVILLKGSAGLLFEGEDNPITLHPGDYILIPAHIKHRVEWIDETEETIWLAIHYG